MDSVRIWFIGLIMVIFTYILLVNSSLIGGINQVFNHLIMILMLKEFECYYSITFNCFDIFVLMKHFIIFVIWWFFQSLFITCLLIIITQSQHPIVMLGCLLVFIFFNN